MYYYLTPWEWVTEPDGSAWSLPGAVGLIDLRSLVDTAREETVAGYAFAAYLEPVSNPGAEYLGDNLHAISESARSTIETSLALGESVAADSLVDAVWNILTVFADSTGQERVKPLIPGSNGMMRLHLGGHSEIKRERFKVGEHPASSQVVAVARADLAEVKIMAEDESSSTPADHHQRMLSALAEKYRCASTEFADYDPLPHSTTLTESWSCADSDSLTCDLTWTEKSGDIDIVSNQANVQTSLARAFARADSDLASDDHYVQVSISTNGVSGGNSYSYAHCREASNTDETHYVGRANWAATNILRCYKFVTGTRTELATKAYTFDRANTYVLYIEMDGSAGDIEVAGTSELTWTDTAITGNLRGGIGGQKESGKEVRFDVWQASDLHVVAAAKRRRVGFGAGRVLRL